MIEFRAFFQPDCNNNNVVNKQCEFLSCWRQLVHTAAERITSRIQFKKFIVSRAFMKCLVIKFICNQTVRKTFDLIVITHSFIYLRDVHKFIYLFIYHTCNNYFMTCNVCIAAATGVFIN